MKSHTKHLVAITCIILSQAFPCYARDDAFKHYFDDARKKYNEGNYGEAEKAAFTARYYLKGEYNASCQNVALYNLFGNIYTKTGSVENARSTFSIAYKICSRLDTDCDPLCSIDVRSAWLKISDPNGDGFPKWSKLSTRHKSGGKSIYYDSDRIEKINDHAVAIYIGIGPNKYSSPNDIEELSRFSFDCGNPDYRGGVSGDEDKNIKTKKIILSDGVFENIFATVCTAKSNIKGRPRRAKKAKNNS